MIYACFEMNLLQKYFKLIHLVSRAILSNSFFFNLFHKNNLKKKKMTKIAKFFIFYFLKFEILSKTPALNSKL